VPLAPATAPTRIVDMSDGATQMFPATGAVAAAPGARPMPPLARQDEDDFLGDEPPVDDRRRRRWLWILLTVLLVGLVAVAAWALTSGGGDGGSGEPTTSTSASAPSSAATVQFDPADWIGDDYREAEALLDAEGFEVTTEPAGEEQLAAAGRELARGGVAATDPATAGPLEVGAPVVLYFAEEGYVPGGGEEPEEPAPTSEAPAETSEAPASETETSASETSTSASETSTSAASSSSVASATSASPPPSETSAEPPPDPGTDEGDGQAAPAGSGE
jgi:hypothetical protein